MKTSDIDDSDLDDHEDWSLRLVAVAYYAVMLVAFVIGLYGLFSLFWLASSESQHAARIVGSLF